MTTNDRSLKNETSKITLTMSVASIQRPWEFVIKLPEPGVFQKKKQKNRNCFHCSFKSLNAYS